MLCTQCRQFAELKKKRSTLRTRERAKARIREKVGKVNKCALLRLVKERAKTAVRSSLSFAKTITINPAPTDSRIIERFVSYYNNCIKSKNARISFNESESPPQSSQKARDITSSLTTRSHSFSSCITAPGEDMELCFSFHGTPACNYDSIFKQGLKIPGSTSGVRVANGSVYGTGIYSSSSVTTSQYYARGTPTILVCGLVKSTSTVSEHGSIYVCKREEAICPLWVLSVK
eukprot:m.77267 g.77267  ORF g.77267 m.77267 type:complete len:232 (+) comp11910_c1_seq1:810-1505(+)